MKYGYLVKHRGKFYPAGTDVPVEVAEETTEETSADAGGTQNPDTENQGAENPDAEKTENEYTKTDINRMPVDELKVLAAKLGVEKAEESTGAVLKEEIIKILGL